MSGRIASHKLSHSNPKKRMPFANNGTIADMYPQQKNKKPSPSRLKPMIKKMVINGGEI